MTCILGLVTDNNLFLASDSRISGSDHLISDHADKVIHAGGWYIGCAGEGRTDDVLRASVDRLSEAGDIFKLTNLIKDALRSDGYIAALAKDDHCGAPEWNGSWMITSEFLGEMWILDSALSPSKMVPYRPQAIGSGGSHAEAACMAFIMDDIPYNQAVREALEVTYEYVLSCGGEIKILEIDRHNIVN